MREAAITAYLVAIILALGTVITAFTQICHGQTGIGLFIAIIGSGIVGLLWAMAHWIDKHNA